VERRRLFLNASPSASLNCTLHV